ncbi:MAG: hypothetical protein ABII23_01080, partial [bacterium]
THTIRERTGFIVDDEEEYSFVKKEENNKEIELNGIIAQLCECVKNLNNRIVQMEQQIEAL